MPATTGDLVRLRSTPQRSRMFLVVQQPERWQGTLYGEEFLWSCQIDGDHTADPTVQLTVDNGGPAVDLLDRMTVLIGSTPGGFDRGFFYLHGDQTVGPATVALDIAQSSEVDNNVLDNDYVTVLDEFRLSTRYPRITEAAGTLSWFKDYDITWAGLGATDALRAQASMPPVPIMGTHRVHFIPIGESVDIDFDWSLSYAMAPGATINAWASEGERASGNWVSAVQNPPAQTYTDADVSGLSGYRVWLELGTDKEDPTAPYMRGVRYVFTLRRPGQRQAGDPTNAEPIVNFEVGSISGSFSQGRWRTSVRVFGSDAAENTFLPGALVILFAEDYYSAVPAYIGPDTDGVGPIPGSENIVMVGRIADGTIQEDPESGEISFDVASLAEQAAKRANYPVPIQNDGAPDEWYKTPTLTISRAVWHYAVWHTTLPLIADLYLFDRDPDSTVELIAQDYLASDVYATIDRFVSDRLFARLLIDRYERAAVLVDEQMEAARNGGTLFTLAASDWINAVSIREVDARRVNLIELGGTVYNMGNVIPYLSNAPGNVSGYQGRPEAHTNLNVASQAALNTLSGRLYAYRNNRFPQGTFPMAGNWRVGDIWPQEYIISNTLVTQRRTFTDRWWLLREITYTYDAVAGIIMATFGVESETDGPPGETVEIPAELPDFTVSPIPRYPPSQPPTPTSPSTGDSDAGRRMVSTDVGIFVTDNIGATSPVWYGSNVGLVSAFDLYAYGMARDPFRWWTSGGTERRLFVFTRSGIWYQDDFPNGTWVRQISYAALLAVTGWNDAPPNHCYRGYFGFSIETDELYGCAFGLPDTAGPGAQRSCAIIVLAGAILNPVTLASRANTDQESQISHPSIRALPHSAGQSWIATSGVAPGNIGDAEARLWRTLNRGAVWSQLDMSLGVADMGINTSVSVPYRDVSNPDLFYLWGSGGGVAGRDGRYRITTDGGGTFADLVDAENDYGKMGTGGDPRYIWLLNYTPDIKACRYSTDQGLTWTDLPLLADAGFISRASFANWQGGVLQSVLIGSNGVGNGLIYRWTAATGWQDKSGNLASFLVTTIGDIERDSMGAP